MLRCSVYFKRGQRVAGVKGAGGWRLVASGRGTGTWKTRQNKLLFPLFRHCPLVVAAVVVGHESKSQSESAAK